MSDVSLSDFSENRSEVNELREANYRLQSQLTQVKAKTDRLVAATHQGALDAMLAFGPVAPSIPPKTDSRRKSIETALWVMTDWQVGKLTTSYNSEVARERALRFVDKAAKITEMHRASRPTKDCLIAFGGDMVEGVSFQFPTQPFEIDSTIFEQYVVASRLMVDVVRRALSIYENVTVVAEWGNHGRMGSKRDAVPRSDNIDRMAYHVAREILASESRLIWEDCPEDIQRIEIGNYRALLIHGDEIGRGGFASPMTIVQHADRWKSGAYPWSFQDVYTNHYHVHGEWPLADGLSALYQTGSLESDNRYARTTMASSAVPSQRLHFIDSDRGRVTAQYRINLDE